MRIVADPSLPHSFATISRTWIEYAGIVCLKDRVTPAIVVVAGTMAVGVAIELVAWVVFAVSVVSLARPSTLDKLVNAW